MELRISERKFFLKHKCGNLSTLRYGGFRMRKMMKKAIALGLIATMSMSAATIVHAEDKVTLRV